MVRRRPQTHILPPGHHRGMSPMPAQVAGPVPPVYSPARSWSRWLLGGLAALVIGAGALVTARSETAGASSAPPEATPASVLLPDFEPYIFRENGPPADPI